MLHKDMWARAYVGRFNNNFFKYSMNEIVNYIEIEENHWEQAKSGFDLLFWKDK